MARTQADILAPQIGQVLILNAALQAENEKLREELAQLKAALQKTQEPPPS